MGTDQQLTQEPVAGSVPDEGSEPAAERGGRTVPRKPRRAAAPLGRVVREEPAPDAHAVGRVVQEGGENAA